MSWGQRISTPVWRHWIGHRRIQLYNGPLTVTIFKCVFHRHPVADCRVAFGMDGHRCICHVFDKSNRGGINVEFVNIETGTFRFQSFENGRLHVLFRIDTPGTADKESKRD